MFDEQAQRAVIIFIDEIDVGRQKARALAEAMMNGSKPLTAAFEMDGFDRTLE